MIILYLLVNNSNGGDKELIFLLLAIVVVFITIIFLIFRLRIYLSLDWQIGKETNYVKVSARALNISIYQKSIDFEDWNLPSFNKTDIKWKERYEAIKKILHASKIEKLDTETIVATDDPIFTAYLYACLKTLSEWVVSMYHKNDSSKVVIGADFEQISFQSVGECMISIKLSKTIKEIWKLK